MSLQKENVYLDDWKDLKEYTEELEKEEAEKKDQHNVTKDFVGEQIEDYKEYDEAKEQAEYDKIYQKIADISAGGGTDLSPYLKKTEAEETYAKKEDIEWIITNDEFNEVVEAKVNAGVQSLVAGAPSDMDTFKEVSDSLVLKADASTVYTKVEADAKFLTEHQDLSDYAKKTDIPDVSQFVTEATVDDKIATEIAKVVADAPEDFDTLKEVADYIASDKTRAAQIETAISDLSTNKADKTDIPDITNFATKAEVAAVDEKVDAIDLTPYATIEYVNSEIARIEEEIPDTSAFITAAALEPYAKKTDIPDTSNLATKTEVAAVEDKIPSIEGLVDEATLAAAVDDKATISQVVDVDTKVDNKIDASLVYTKTEADAKFLTEHQDLSDYAKKTDIPDTSNLATKDELATVDAKVDAIDLTTYATKNDISVFATKSELDEKANAADVTAALSEKATIAQVAAVEAKIPDVSNLASKDEVATADTSVLQNILGRIWTKKTANPSDGHFYSKLTNANGSYSLIFNESDGGGSQFKDNKTISYVGVNDGGDNTSTGIFAQIYSKDVSSNIGSRMNVNPSGIYYGVGSSTPMDAAHEVAVKGDVENAVADKANASEVPTKTEFEALKANYEALRQLVFEYLPSAEEEAIADGEIADLSPSNKSIAIETEMASIEVPATTTLYTVQAPLRNDATVELTSDYSFSFDNMSEEPVNAKFVRQTAVGETKVTGTTVNLSGQFDELTLENISIATRSGKDPITVNNLTVPETNEKELSVNAQFQDGAIIKNDSDKQITITNRTDNGSEVVIVSPNSTVVLSGGEFTTLTSETADNTLIVNANTNIDKLILKKGNVIVKDFDVSARISEVEDQSAGQYVVTPYIVEISDASKFASTLTSTSGILNVTNNLEGVRAAGFGIFANNRVRVNLSNHTVSGGNNNYVIYTRGTAVVDIWDGTIDATAEGYGIWCQGGTVNLHNVHVIGCEHAIYLSNAAGEINVYGGRLEVNGASESTNYVVNYLDSVYASGCRAIHLFEGTECVDYDPANAPSETGHPNLLEPGYHTESREENGHTIWTVVKDSE